MKRILTLVAAIAMLAASSVASAADNLWFSLANPAPAGVTVESSGPGTALSLTNPTGNPLTVRVNVNITSDTNLFTWSMALASVGGTFSNGAFGPAGGSDQPFGGTNGSAAFAVSNGSIPGAGLPGVLYSFDLNLPAGVGAVTGDFGPSGILKQPNTFWYGFVGPNPISIAGGPAYTFGEDTTVGWGQLPVITVAIPEPATLGLLALGVVAIIRRRK